ncbi:MAG TPA: hypothetical protein VFR42_01500 [Candidatus Acidoferrum sp.]|nr:hypothetical protein [Candidatus Acidoferrum sp.]
MTAATFNNGAINSNLTVNGAPGLNIVNLNNFTLSGNLTLNGAPGTQVVININGNFNPCARI